MGNSNSLSQKHSKQKMMFTGSHCRNENEITTFFALKSEKIITIFYVCFMAPLRSTLYSYSILRLRQYLRKIKTKISNRMFAKKIVICPFPLSAVARTHNCLRTPFALSLSSNRRNKTILNSFIHRIGRI